MRKGSGKAGGRVGHLAGGAITTVAIAWHFRNREDGGGQESGKSEAEARHLDVRGIYGEDFLEYVNLSKMNCICNSKPTRAFRKRE